MDVSPASSDNSQGRQTGVFLRKSRVHYAGGGGRPDIIITRDNAPPIVLENEYYPANTLYNDCMKRIGHELNSDKMSAVGTVNTVVAIRSPLALKDCANNDEAEEMLIGGIELEYAVYQGTIDKYTRFPTDGFVTGDVRNLIEFIRPAAVPENAINRAADALTEGAQDIAILMLNAKRNTDFGVMLGERLRQPWPVSDRIPETPSEIKQARADRDARLQTAKMCATIVINALAYQQILAGHNGIRDLEYVRKETIGGRLTKSAVIAEWENILEINYWPIFHIARELLLIIPSVVVDRMLPRAAETAESIQTVMQQNDVAGIVFQRLIADRQTLATYYTRPESTVLAAHLAIPLDLDWGDPGIFKDYYIADYACGTGGLILAAYQRVRELHRNQGGDPDQFHAHMMEEALTACDIMPAAVHLSSALLSSVALQQQYDGTRNILYPFGGVKRRDLDGKIITDVDGRPILEMDAKGNPEVDIGSLELLDLKSRKYQVVLPLNEKMAMGASGKRSQIEVEMVPLSQSLVIMNPPFTTPTNHAADHVDTKNPAFAAFGTTGPEQSAMEAKVRRLSKGTVGDGYAGLGSQFTAIADHMVKSGGHIALILPLSAMLGGSFDGKVVRSWQKLRRMLAEEYNDIIVNTIAQPVARDSAFSADTDLAECLIVARRRHAKESPHKRVYFVNLFERPGTKLAAQEVARSIQRTIMQIEGNESHAPICVGNDEVGSVRLESVHPLEKWTTVRVSNIELVHRAKRLAKGELLLPQRAGHIRIPIVRMGRIGRVGPVHRSILTAFRKREGYGPGTEYPMLWKHDELKGKTQTSMSVSPDSSGSIKRGKHDDVAKIWSTATHLHICNDFGFNANATVACFTEQRSIGGRTWPTLQMHDAEKEKVTCVWMNSTLGLVSYWMESNRSQGARGSTTVTAIPNIPTLNPSDLSPNALRAAVTIYEDMSRLKMLPANEAYRDEVRQELDRRILTEVLELDEESVDQLGIMRNQWCAEPTVNGIKKTGIMYTKG